MNGQTEQKIEGILLCKVVVPRENTLQNYPFLTMNYMKKNMSFMCYTCVKENNQGMVKSLKVL